VNVRKKPTRKKSAGKILASLRKTLRRPPKSQAGKVIRTLVALAHEPRQAMWTGADDPRKLFYVVSGLWLVASNSDRVLLGEFIEALYTKYGRDSAFGWYKSLDNHTGNSLESVRLFYRELCAYFPRIRPQEKFLAV
jgi:hypothetical protein